MPYVIPDLEVPFMDTHCRVYLLVCFLTQSLNTFFAAIECIEIKYHGLPHMKGPYIHTHKRVYVSLHVIFQKKLNVSGIVRF